MASEDTSQHTPKGRKLVKCEGDKNYLRYELTTHPYVREGWSRTTLNHSSLTL